jgi:catechol 2,3-dioxygenase-like lactoylglutathione lyase family enzyme
VKVERISAVTFKVSNMRSSVEFYRDVLGLKLIYGGENAPFSSLRTEDEHYTILNLELGKSVGNWGRLIFYVDDVDSYCEYLEEKGFHPQKPRDAAWGERYFHMLDPDEHELSFARPLK